MSRPKLEIVKFEVPDFTVTGYNPRVMAHHDIFGDLAITALDLAHFYPDERQQYNHLRYHTILNVARGEGEEPLRTYQTQAVFMGKAALEHLVDLHIPTAFSEYPTPTVVEEHNTYVEFIAQRGIEAAAAKARAEMQAEADRVEQALLDEQIADFEVDFNDEEGGE